MSIKSDVAALAQATKNELERRGAVSGELATYSFWDYDDSGEYVPVYNAPLSDCKVCVLGAAGAAAFNNPELGYGAGEEDVFWEAGQLNEVHIHTEFVHQLSELVLAERPELGRYIKPVDDPGTRNSVVTTWFDQLIKTQDPRDDADPEKLAVVYAALDKIIANNTGPQVSHENGYGTDEWQVQTIGERAAGVQPGQPYSTEESA